MARKKGKLTNSLKHFASEYLKKPLQYELFIINGILRLLYEEDPKLYQEKVELFMHDTEKTLVLLRCSFSVATGIWGQSYFLQDKNYILPNLTIEMFDKLLGEISEKDYNGENMEYLSIFLKLKKAKFNPTVSYTKELKRVTL